jgi:hypothetical protein
MKKLLLSTFILLFTCINSFSQGTIEFTIEAPASIGGAYGFSFYQ